MNGESFSLKKKSNRIRTKPEKNKQRLIDPWKRQPGFQTFYDLGVAMSRGMPVFRTFDEIGAVFGITKQNAYTEAVVALGKLAFAVKQRAMQRK